MTKADNRLQKTSKFLVSSLSIVALASGLSSVALGQEGAATSESPNTAETPQSGQEATESSGAASQSAQDANNPEASESDQSSAGGAADAASEKGKNDAQVKPATGSVGGTEANELLKTQNAASPDFHAETPKSLRNRLRMTFGASLGTGSGPSAFASDYLGFYVGGVYAFARLDLPGLPLVWLASGQYSSQTGIDKDESLDLVVQRFMVGGGAEVAPKVGQFRLGALAHLGLSRAAAADFAPTGGFKTSHGVAVSLSGHARYQVVPKIWAVAGVELVPVSGDHSWYGATLGSSFSF